jgi:hypothetical protein
MVNKKGLKEIQIDDSFVQQRANHFVTCKGGAQALNRNLFSCPFQCGPKNQTCRVIQTSATDVAQKIQDYPDIFGLDCVSGLHVVRNQAEDIKAFEDRRMIRR